MSKNLVLTGMMGVGKSTIGRSLAKKHSYSFIDVDELIETVEGSSISLIFKNKSENYFRKLENEITLIELKKKSSVIALGGGAFLNKNIRRTVKNSSVSFWLDVNIEELSRRLKSSKKRPLLNKKNLNETIQKIYIERHKTYNESDFRIKCNFQKPEDIVEKIFKFMKRKEIKFKNSSQGYSIIIGENILGILPKKIKVLCPKSKNIALVIDKNVPKKFKIL